MRSATHDIAFVGWFVGAHTDVWRVEPFGYLSEDADVWAIMTGAVVPVWRGGLGRLSVRFGTEIVLYGPAVEPGARPLGARAGRVGGRYEVCGVRRPGTRVHVDTGRVLRSLVESWVMVGRVRCSPRPSQTVLRNPVCNEGKDGGSTVSLGPISLFI